MIKLSVVIPTYNRRHILERTLSALSAQDFPPEDYEVIVVIDGSTDSTAEFLRGWKPKFAWQALAASHRGAGAARNVGIRAAMGELVLFLDDDLIAPPDLLGQHCAEHTGRGPSVVHGPIYMAPGSSQTVIRYVMQHYYDGFHRQMDAAMDLRYPKGLPASMGSLIFLANSSMPRDVLVRLGGFDERILAAEDLELGLRMWKMGVSFRYRPTAIAHEFYVKSSRQYLKRQARAFGAGDLMISRKHPEYRPHSDLSAFAELSFPRRWLRIALMRMPVSPVPLFGLIFYFEKWFCRISLMRRIGARWLRYVLAVAQWRGALSGAGSYKAWEREFNRRAPGLVYHHVGPSRPGTYGWLTVSPKRFERQIKWLARRGYVGIKPSDWLHWRNEGKPIPRKPILITFDDAYADTAEHALPILLRYGFSAAVFVVTERLGATNTWDEAKGSGTHRLMTAEQIRYWAGQGIEFGAHSRTHEDLTKLSESEQSAEVLGSKNDLCALLDSPVVSFAYPYGEFNDAICDLVGREFDLAFSLQEGMNYLSGDPRVLKRAQVVGDDSFVQFALGVGHGKLDWPRQWRARLGLRTRLKQAMRRVAPGLPQRKQSNK